MMQLPGRSKSFNVRMMHPPDPLVLITRRSDPRQQLQQQLQRSPPKQLMRLRRLAAMALATFLVTILVVAISRSDSESPRLRMTPAMRRAAAASADFRPEDAAEELLKSVQLDLEKQAQLQTQLEQMVQARAKSDFDHKLQGISEKALFSRFGKGPYRVEVIMANANANSESSSSFVLEMISVKEMPHTVHHFLEMVEYGLWDGMTLVHGMGVQSVHAIPQNSRGEYAQQKFDNVQLGSLPFEESGGYPHEKYTVSFSKRRGPDFYINLQDNTEHNDFASCFAKVVEGFDVLDRIVSGGDNLDNMRFFDVEQMRVA